MLALIAKMKVKEGQEADCEKFAVELAAQVEANEPGNKLYKLCKDPGGEYVFVELYEDQAALGAHQQTPHFQAAGPKFAEALDGRPEITVLRVLGD